MTKIRLSASLTYSRMCVSLTSQPTSTAQRPTKGRVVRLTLPTRATDPTFPDRVAALAQVVEAAPQSAVVALEQTTTAMRRVAAPSRLVANKRPAETVETTRGKTTPENSRRATPNMKPLRALSQPCIRSAVSRRRIRRPTPQRSKRKIQVSEKETLSIKPLDWVNCAA